VVRVLLDEDLDVRLRLHFGDVAVAETVEYRGWKGLRNGELLDAIASSGAIDVFVTADRKLRHQQNLASFPFATLVVRPPRNRLPELVALMPEILRLLPVLRPGEVVEVPSPPDERRHGTAR
jgi:hypothetical protein